MTAVYSFRGRESFPPDKVAKIDAVVAGLPSSALNYMVNADVPIVYLSDKEIESMPPSLRGQLRFAKAVCWNHIRINIPEKQMEHLQTPDLAHELTHMAYTNIPQDVKEEARKTALEIGRKVVEFARKRKRADPLDEDWEYKARLTRRDMAMLTRKKGKAGADRDRQFSHELSLVVPTYRYAEIARHLGVDLPENSDQYATICVNLYLSQKHKLGLFMGEEDEEIVAYRVGNEPKYAERVFNRVGDKIHEETVAKTEREGRLEAFATQSRRTGMSQRMDRTRLARTVLSPSQVQKWKKHPNRSDLEGIDTPPRLSR
jgi:hypothetical protein